MRLRIARYTAQESTKLEAILYKLSISNEYWPLITMLKNIVDPTVKNIDNTGKLSAPISTLLLRFSNIAVDR